MKFPTDEELEELKKLRPTHRYIRYTNEKDCGHNDTCDLSTKYITHTMCFECHHHSYNGKEYTREEWDTWVNSTGQNKELK